MTCRLRWLPVGEGKSSVFLFSDTQIKDEAFVEDINNLLNSGEVPNMFPSDEKMQVRKGSQRLQPLCVQPCRAAGTGACTVILPVQVAPHHLDSSPSQQIGHPQDEPLSMPAAQHLTASILSLQVLEMVRSAASKRGLETPVELWGYFVEQCRQRLHVVLCMSPIGNAFRDRLRQNPSLINCCTIDWFQVCPCSTRCLCRAQTAVHKAHQGKSRV